ncbi:MAG: DNA methyltransferase [Microcoleus sp.]
MTRRIERSVKLKASQLLPNPWNPYRNKSDRLQEAIAESIGEFDQIQDIVCRPHPSIDGHYQILDGEGRHRTFDPDADVYVTIVHGLTDAQAKKVTIVMDETRATADPELLSSLLSELSEDYSIDDLVTGLPYDEDQLTEMIETGGAIDFDGPPVHEDEDDLAAIEDAAADPEYVPRVKAGEIWKLGRHYVACGDCTIEENVGKLLNGRSAQLIHADPPYGMGKEKDGVINDNLYRDKLDAFQMLWWNEGRKYLDDNGSVYVWGNCEDLWRLWYKGGLRDSERLTFRNQVVWDKKSGQGMMSDAHRMYPTATEHCLFFMRGEQGFNNNADMFFDGWAGILEWLQEQKQIMKWTASEVHQILEVGDKGGGLASHYFGKSQWMLPTEPHYKKLQQAAHGKAFKREYDDIKREWHKTRAYFDNTHDNMTDVWNYPRVKGEDRWGHATPKPIEMMQRIYKSSCPKNGLIYSPFLGSGSDLIAAEEMGDRTVIGFELSAHYCSLICDRWEKLTGGTAEHIGNL